MSEELLRRDGASIGEAGKLRFNPMVADVGRGAELLDSRGRSVLDFSGGWGAASLGYGHPAVVDAVSRAVREMPGVGSLSLLSPPSVALAEALLAKVTDAGPKKVWFGHSGTDACDAALRLATADGRIGVISFRGAYHGGFGGGMAISGHQALGGAGSYSNLLQLDYPSSRESASAVLDRLGRELRTAEYGALFVEPILSDGGLIVPPEGFLAGVAAECRAAGVRVVCDEVKAGSGRTGRWHCHEWEGIAPDFIVLGKGLGGGLPISAVIGPAELLDRAPSSAMLTTQGNPVTVAAALAVVATVGSPEFLASVARTGERLRGALQRLVTPDGPVAAIRGRGMMIGVELRDTATATTAEAAARVSFRAWQLGLLCYYVGTGTKVLELTPPLTLTDAETDRGVAILERAIIETEQGAVDATEASRWRGW